VATRSDTPAGVPEPTPHPLAAELAETLRGISGARALVLGIGSGRNVPVLIDAGATVAAIEDDPERARAAMIRYAAEGRVRIARSAYAGPYPFAGPFDVALATHALLHGTPTHVAAAIAAVGNRLAPSACFFFTLGSKRDPRFGSGRLVAPDTFVADDGSEAGVAHGYFDETGVRALLDGFTIDGVAEVPAPGAAGAWAHTPGELATIVHWFVRARRTGRDG